MHAYRLYLLDKNDHIRSAIDLECADDAGAISEAEQRHPRAAMELWQGARIIKKFAGEEAFRTAS